MIIGAPVLLTGIIVLILSRTYNKKSLLNSGKQKVRVFSRGHPILITDFFVPTSAILKIEFDEEKKRKVVFKVVKEVRLHHIGPSTGTEQHDVLCSEIVYRGKEISFKLENDPNTKHKLMAEGDIEGISKEGLEHIAKIFGRYFNVRRDGGTYTLILEMSPTEGSSEVEVRHLMEMFQPVLYSNFRGEELRDALVAYAKNTGYEKYFSDWSSKYPALWDEIATVVHSESSSIATRAGVIRWRLTHIERPYEWFSNVGLTLITTGVVIFLAGLK